MVCVPPPPLANLCQVVLDQCDRVGPALSLELWACYTSWGLGEAAVFVVESARGLAGRRCPPQCSTFQGPYAHHVMFVSVHVAVMC